MKILIWIGCFIIATILNTLLGYATGFKAGYLLFYLAVYFVSRRLCSKWDEHKANKAILGQNTVEAMESNGQTQTDNEEPRDVITPMSESAPTYMNADSVGSTNESDEQNSLPKIDPPKVQLPKLEKKKWKIASIVFILVLLLCGIGWIGYNYFSYSNALDNGKFIQAERYFEMIPFCKEVLPSQYEYLSAGVLWEEGKYIDAYNAFKNIEDTSVPAAILNDLESTIYSIGQTAYQVENYEVAEKHFRVIKEYKRSSDYLLLMSCFVFDSFQEYSNARNNIKTHYSELIELFNDDFENVKELFLQYDSMLE